MNHFRQQDVGLHRVRVRREVDGHNVVAGVRVHASGLLLYVPLNIKAQRRYAEK